MPNIDKLMKNLNDLQKSAVLHDRGPAVVFAGAGSGKTRIITTRIAYLIEQGVKPWQIFAVTFTNKAAGEMRERIENLTPKGGRVFVSTFHSACARWMREFAPELGFTSDFTIYDDSDSKTAIKRVLKDLNIRLDGDYTPKDYQSAISRLKTKALLPSEAAAYVENFPNSVPPFAVKVYKQYQEYLAACNAMDFGDLIMNVLLLLRKNEVVRKALQARYKYVLVDEYQDTNPTQFEMISYLIESHKNLFVVGDDDQAIYSWRGANPANILDFEKIFPGARRYILEQNYRSNKIIVGAASEMVSHNRRRAAKNLWSDNDSNELIDFYFEQDGESEAWQVAELINAEKNYDLRDVAIFYRTNSQSRAVEEALRYENIPYRIYGAVKFYDRAEIKDLLAYLKLIQNENDDVSLQRVINTPTRGIGKKAVESIMLRASQNSESMMAALRQMAEENIPRTGKKFTEFLALYERLKSAILNNHLDKTVAILLSETAYLDYLEKKYPDDASERIENVNELGVAISQFARDKSVTLKDWLQHVSLASDNEGDAGGVSIMTLHMAKGLEYERVYIVGVEDGLIPHRNNIESESLLEEERRLLYVGMTRAKKKLTLSSANIRQMFGKWMSNDPSRFLREIPEKYFVFHGVEAQSSAPVNAYDPYGAQIAYDMDSQESAGDSSDGEPVYDSHAYDESFDEPDAQLIRPGATVSHPTYGLGIVEKIQQDFKQPKAVVNFQEFGHRKIALHHLEVK